MRDEQGEWFQQLKEIVAAHQDAPWQRGARDCGTFACDCLKVITGEDAMAEWRGSYSSWTQLLRLIRGSGHADLSAYVAAWCSKRGFPEIDPVFCQCGDLGLTAHGIVAIRMPVGFLAFSETGELGIVNPTRAWAIAWA